MTPIESIFYMIWRGIAIGVLISAPMGPVGILCIQRTLDKGRHAGFYTGIGAAISDIIYCLLTGFGLSFIEDFLNENQNVIQLIGSVVLIAFSIYLFKKNPSSVLRRPVPQNVSVKKNILGGFLFTFSNPLIIFLIIGLFARFNFTNPDIKGYYYAIGYLFIVVGALGWWYGITYAIDKVRSRFNMRSMKIMNIIIGIVILGFACVGIITSILGLTSANASAQSPSPAPYTTLRPLLPAGNQELFKYSNKMDSTLMVPLEFAGKGDAAAGALFSSPFQLDFKLGNAASSPIKRYEFFDATGKRHHTNLPAWGIMAIDNAGDTLAFEIRPVEFSATPLDSQAATQLNFRLYGNPATSASGISGQYVATKGVDPASGFNHFRLLYSPDDGVQLLCGNRTLSPIFSITDIPDFKPSALFLTLTPGAAIEVKDLSLLPVSSPGTHKPSLSLDEIEMRLRVSADLTEGRWTVLDRTMNESLLKSGGEYKLAIIRRPDADYEIIYLGGATTNASKWQPGMLKGKLKQTDIPTIYNLEWIDSFGDVLSYQLKAQREDADIITLQFPYHESSLRLHRINSF